MIRIPRTILTCKSLVRLSLGFSDFVLDILDCTVYFPCLKSLSIYVNHPNNNFMQKLFRSCPILEELKIKGCNDRDRNVLTFDINVPTLKKLNFLLMADDNEYILVHRFLVRARNLEYLHVHNDFSACSVLGETPFLNKVILDCKDNVEELYGSPNDEATDRATEFFRAISSTRFLSLDVTLVCLN